jgi:bifunctional UDP-N-acetylglucosamine pyrophosphorylase/glucosamine-1-phosphate N-acetyltransferase
LSDPTTAPLASLVLAAGKGTRMRSRLPKVLHSACGRTLLEWSLLAARGAGADRTVVVVSPDSQQMADLVPDWAVTAVQREPRGTGDAVLAAREALSGFDGDVLVAYADTPLVDAETLRGLVEAHRAANADASLLTITRDERTGADFGRIVRDPSGGLARIIELRDADAEQRELREVNSGICIFRSSRLWPALERLTPDNDQAELYLTDVFGLLVADGGRVIAHRGEDAAVAHGINTRVDLAEADARLRDRINRAHMLAGVTMVDPATTFVEADVELEQDVILHPFTVLRGTTRVESGAEIGPHVVAVDATIGRDARVGPFCYLRPGATLLAGAKAGTFVEVKNSVIGEGAKVPHLSYIGDAEIGSGSNIGAGAITANYDGSSKQRTTIGKDVHTSSHNVFVAPVTIHDGAWTAAGSVITDDIPPDALGVARAKQTNIEGYGKRKRSQR